jgi:hypothetical protein
MRSASSTNHPSTGQQAGRTTAGLTHARRLVTQALQPSVLRVALQGSVKRDEKVFVMG